ncbi:MAG: hypothetical protein LBS02_07665 [Hungatella sp.]|jgi:hypothetical protein|nr:hypothetical protein [Hungatella sp.]
MKLPIIKVRDNCTKKEFIVTDSNSHNYLYADKEGIHYYNLQNGEGTGKYASCGYSFVGEDGYMGTDIPMIDMVDLFALYYETKMKTLNDPKLTLDLDLIAGHFKVLDIRVESKLKERSETFQNEMAKYLQEKYGGEDDGRSE